MKRKKRCCWCLKWFDSHVRLKERQKTCGSSTCKRQQNLSNQKRWKRKEYKVYHQNQQDWHESHPHYWKEYRKKNKGYAERNRIQSRIRKSYSKLSLQKKLNILEVADKSMEYWYLGRFAKQTRSLIPLLWAYERGHATISSSSPDS